MLEDAAVVEDVVKLAEAEPAEEVATDHSTPKRTLGGLHQDMLTCPHLAVARSTGIEVPKRPSATVHWKDRIVPRQNINKN